MKNYIKFKKEYYNIISGLNDKQAGEFAKGICDYAFNNKPFETKDSYLKGAFLYIKKDLDISTQNAVNGKKGGLMSAEIRRESERKRAIGRAVLTGRIAAKEAFESLVNCLKDEKCNKTGKEG